MELVDPADPEFGSVGVVELSVRARRSPCLCCSWDAWPFRRRRPRRSSRRRRPTRLCRLSHRCPERPPYRPRRRSHRFPERPPYRRSHRFLERQPYRRRTHRWRPCHRRRCGPRHRRCRPLRRPNLCFQPRRSLQMHRLPRDRPGRRCRGSHLRHRPRRHWSLPTRQYRCRPSRPTLHCRSHQHPRCPRRCKLARSQRREASRPSRVNGRRAGASGPFCPSERSALAETGGCFPVEDRTRPDRLKRSPRPIRRQAAAARTSCVSLHSRVQSFAAGVQSFDPSGRLGNRRCGNRCVTPGAMSAFSRG